MNQSRKKDNPVVAGEIICRLRDGMIDLIGVCTEVNADNRPVSVVAPGGKSSYLDASYINWIGSGRVVTLTEWKMKTSVEMTPYKIAERFDIKLSVIRRKNGQTGPVTIVTEQQMRERMKQQKEKNQTDAKMTVEQGVVAALKNMIDTAEPEILADMAEFYLTCEKCPLASRCAVTGKTKTLGSCYSMLLREIKPSHM